MGLRACVFFIYLPISNTRESSHKNPGFRLLIKRKRNIYIQNWPSPLLHDNLLELSLLPLLFPSPIPCYFTPKFIAL